jgi:hypothetical protein
MSVEDDYPEYRRWALRVHTASLTAAVEAEKSLAQGEVASHMMSRSWWAYEGPDVDPFALYTRWQPGRVSIASIAGLGSRKGRLPMICAAFEATGLTVRWESVINRHLRYALRRRGYQSLVPEPCSSTDLILEQDQTISPGLVR